MSTQALPVSAAEARARAAELERARQLAWSFTRFLGLAWNQKTSERGLQAAVEDLAARLADVMDLDSLGRTANEAQADAQAEVVAFGQAEPDEPSAAEVAALLASAGGLQEEG